MDILRKIESDRRIDLNVTLSLLVFISIMRMIMETLLGSSDYIVFTNLSSFLLVFSFYALALVSYTFFLSICSGKKPIKIVRILTPCLLFALAVPLVDYFITDYPVSYQMSNISDFDILRISYNNPAGESVILWSIPFLSAIYVFLSSRSIKRSLLTFIVIFFMPVLLATDISDFFGLTGVSFFLYATMASIIFLILLFYIQNEEKFGRFLIRFYERMNRVVLYIILFFFGIATTGSLFSVSFLGIYILILLIISLIAMCVNDYFDVRIDEVNRKNNLLKSLEKEDLRNIIIISLIVLVPFLDFISEGTNNVLFVYYVIVMLLLIFLYSYKNFVKSILPFNYLTDAFSYSITFMAGRSLLVVHSQLELAYFIMSTLIFLLLVPIKDHQDYRGDKKFLVSNLYTVLNFKSAFRISKIFLTLAFIIFTACFIFVLPVKTISNIIAFYVIPSVIMITIMILNFKRTENVETSIWLIDILLLIYLIPFLL